MRRPIITPHSLPQFKTSHANPKRMKEKSRTDPVVSKKPEQPLQGPFGKGGRISSSGTITQLVMKNIHKLKDRDEDPREALLKYAEEAKENPMWVSPAYNKTQPKPIFNKHNTTVDEIKFLEKTKKDKCPRCGLKFCVCNKQL